MADQDGDPKPPAATRRKRRRWKVSRYDLVLGLGMISIVYGATVAESTIGAALIGVGPILIGMGLGFRWEKGP